MNMNNKNNNMNNVKDVNFVSNKAVSSSSVISQEKMRYKYIAYDKNGKTIETNIKVKQSDLELFDSLKNMQ